MYVSSTGSDTKGNGTINKPYATIQKAYDAAWQNSTIYVMDNIIQGQKITMDKNKDVIITSYNKNGDINSIIRDSTLITHLFDVQNGTLTLENITINGNDVPAQDSMINVASEVYMEEGTLITKANNINDWGGGFSVNGGTLTMNGGTISECSSPSGGTAIFVFYDHQEGDNYEDNKTGTFILNDGYIVNNTGGNIIWTAGIIKLNGGIISNNTSTSNSIIANYGEMTISNGIIEKNSVNIGGGSIIACANYLKRYCSIEMTGGRISENTADSSTIEVGNLSIFILNGGSIMNNLSINKYGGININVDTGKYTYKSGVVCGNTPANEYETSSTCPN